MLDVHRAINVSTDRLYVHNVTPAAHHFADKSRSVMVAFRLYAANTTTDEFSGGFAQPENSVRLLSISSYLVHIENEVLLLFINLTCLFMSFRSFVRSFFRSFVLSFVRSFVRSFSPSFLPSLLSFSCLPLLPFFLN